MENKFKIAILLKYNDGKIRQMTIPNKNLEKITKLLEYDNGNIKVLDETLEGVKIL